MRIAVAGIAVVASVFVLRARETVAGEPAPASWLQGIVVLKDGESIDLDTASVLASSAARDAADVLVTGGAIKFARSRRVAKDVADLLAPVSDRPWSVLTTDGGRQAAVQVLRGAAPIGIRYVVAPPGVTGWRPAPRDPHCLGSSAKIDVWFEERPEYVRYRVERRVGPEGAFAAVGFVEHPPFSDLTVKDVTRYGYRIYGVAKDGVESVPAEVQGTTESMGVVSKSALIFRYNDPPEVRCLDLLRGVADPAYDLRFVGGIGWQGARFADARESEVHSYRAADGDVSSPWAVPFDGPAQAFVQRGEPYFVALRGGGVALCRFRYDPAPDASPERHPALRIDSIVNPDGPTLGPATTLAAQRGDERSVTLTLTAPAGHVLDEVEVLGPDGTSLRRLKCNGRSAIDSTPENELYRIYTAVARDARGRRAAPGRVVLDERPAESKSGEVTLSPWKGWSFAVGRPVALEDSDVVARGSHTVQVVAPAGVVNAFDLTQWFETEASVKDLFSAIVSFDARRVSTLRRDGEGDDRTAATDVFIVRCRSGGWAKVAVLSRDPAKDGNWQNSTITMAYSFNPREPVFDARTVVQKTGGLGFAKSIRGGGASGMPWK